MNLSYRILLQVAKFIEIWIRKSLEDDSTVKSRTGKDLNYVLMEPFQIGYDDSWYDLFWSLTRIRM